MHMHAAHAYKQLAIMHAYSLIHCFTSQTHKYIHTAFIPNYFAVWTSLHHNSDACPSYMQM